MSPMQVSLGRTNWAVNLAEPRRVGPENRANAGVDPGWADRRISVRTIPEYYHSAFGISPLPVRAVAVSGGESEKSPANIFASGAFRVQRQGCVRYAFG